MTIKVHILTQCERCKGDGYLPIGQALSSNGKPYIRHEPCPLCDGSGTQPKWIDLEEFAELLKQETCPHPLTTHHGGFHFTAGEVWDDIVEVCSDCGKVLD